MKGSLLEAKLAATADAVWKGKSKNSAMEGVSDCEELVGVTWRLSDCEELVGGQSQEMMSCLIGSVGNQMDNE